ncbi:MAG: serine/threonine-protein kinase [Myxococcota bacterium]
MQPGDRIGTYEILEKLGSGGMAELYRARRVGPHGFARVVALKVVRPHLAGQLDFVRMFLDEGRLAARVHHPHVVHIEELGEDRGRHFLVMEFVHGAALSDLLVNVGALGRRLAPAAAVAIAMRAAAGLHAAHEIRGDDGTLLQLVHRDVSPQNILLGANGAVKLIDFGIAKARDRLHVTDPGSGFRGKLRYMAPEQFREPRNVDRRTDLYALGVVLWEMLTMRRLFEGKRDDEVLAQVVRGGLPAPSRFAPVPPALDAVVRDVLAADAAVRPATARELRQRLRDAVPEASSVDAVELSALLWAACPRELAPAGEETPELEVRPADALARLTERLTEGFDDATTVPETAAPRAFEATAPAEAFSWDDDARPPLREASSLEGASHPPPPAPSPAPTWRAPSLLVLALAGLALFLLGAIAAVLAG